MGMLLVLRSGTNFTQSVTDNVGSTDSAATNTDHVFTQVDDVGATDSSSSFAAHALIITDNVGSTDGFLPNPVTDTLPITDSVQFGYDLHLFDNASPSDTKVAAPAPAYTDSTGLTDSVSFIQNLSPLFSDSAGLSDLVSLSFSFNVAVDDAGLADPFTVPKILNQSAADDSGLTDTASFTVNGSLISPALVDTASLTDTVLAQCFHIVNVTDTLGGSDSVGVSAGYARIITDLAGATESVSAVDTPPQALTLSVTDLVGSSDSRNTASVTQFSVTDLTGNSDSTFAAAKTLTISVLDLCFPAPADTLVHSAVTNLSFVDNVGLDGSYANRDQHRGNSGRVITMVEYITRTQE